MNKMIYMESKSNHLSLVGKTLFSSIPPLALRPQKAFFYLAVAVRYRFKASPLMPIGVAGKGRSLTAVKTADSNLDCECLFKNTLFT